MGFLSFKEIGYQKNKIKSPMLMFSMLLLLFFAIGGTLAFIAVSTNRVTNEFEAANVSCNVNASRDSINITNMSNIDAYIRAAIIVNWMDDQGNVRGMAPTSADYELKINDNDWLLAKDGFYYYKQSCSPKGTDDANTSALVESITLLTTPPVIDPQITPVKYYKLSVEVVAEAIQAEGKDSNEIPVVQLVWPTVKLNSSGILELNSTISN